METNSELDFIEEFIFDDKELMAILPILKDEYWKKAKQGKKMEFLKTFHNVINQAYGYCLPEKMKVVEDMEEVSGYRQDFYITDDYFYVSKALVKNDVNPYLILKAYLKEVFMDGNKAIIRDSEGVDPERVESYVVNNTASLLGEWDNFISNRYDPDFIYQPIVYDAFIKANWVTKRLLKRIYEKQGIDAYLGTAIVYTMEEETELNEEMDMVVKNYEKMKKNYTLVDEEKEIVNRLIDYLSQNNSVSAMSDDEFYGMFNTALVPCFDENSRILLYREFMKRALDNSEESQFFIDSCMFGTLDNGDEPVLVINGKAVAADPYSELSVVLDELIEFKINYNMMKEIDDEKLKEEVKMCSDKLNEIASSVQEGGKEIFQVYLFEALPNFEVQQILHNYYFYKIKKAINNSEITTRGLPLIYEHHISKFDAFLNYIYGMSYDEVREKQIKSLLEKDLTKNGGRRDV